MHPHVRAALYNSIAHWLNNTTANSPEDVDTSVDSCALCDLFYQDECNGCPVAEQTEDVECSGSPYGEVYFSKSAWDRIHPHACWIDHWRARERCRAAIDLEYNFLLSLLPSE